MGKKGVCVALVLCIIFLLPSVHAQNTLDEALDSPAMKTILIIPILGGVLIFFRLILGIQTYGMFGPLVIALSLLETGIKEGMALYLFLLLVGTVFKMIITRMNLPLVAEVGMIMVVLSFAIAAYTVYVSSQPVSAPKILFPLIITSFIIERFSQNLQVHKTGHAFSSFFLTILSAFLLAILGEFLLRLSPTILLGILGISFFFIFALGNYVGMRLSEVFRFKFLGEGPKG